MNRNQIRNFLVVSALLVFTAAGMVWAHDGWGGRGGHMMDYDDHMRGYGGHMMGPGYGYGNLSQEDYAKLEAAREEFFAQTRDLRQKLDEKRFELQQELAREKPHRNKVIALQGDISKLRSEFEAKAREDRFAVREMMPAPARGSAYAGGYRGGYCW